MTTATATTFTVERIAIDHYPEPEVWSFDSVEAAIRFMDAEWSDVLAWDLEEAAEALEATGEYLTSDVGAGFEVIARRVS